MDSVTREPAELMTRPRSRRWLMALLCLLLVAGIGSLVWFWQGGAGDQAARNRNANQPIPVLVSPAEQKDVPIYLDGLGTVQAFNTVTIKAMVDGPLIDGEFHRGPGQSKRATCWPRSIRAPIRRRLTRRPRRRRRTRRSLPMRALDLARYTKLAANNYTSAQQADTAKALVAQLEALVQQDQAQIDTARTQLSYTTITSPIDGAHRHPAGRRRQHRARLGYHGPGRDDPAAADIGAVHPAAADTAGGGQGDAGGHAQGAGLCARRRPAARPDCWTPAP